MLRRVLFALFLAALAAAQLPAQTPFQVADLGTQPDLGEDLGFYFLAPFVELDGVVYFTASDGIHGTELWASDGTAAGTSLVKDICPGLCASRIQELVVAGSRLFFQAEDGLHGFELWTSDGTAEGTALVADVVPGLNGSSPGHLRPWGSGVLFSAYTPEAGRELWASDGTAAGTALVVDLFPGIESSNPSLWEAEGGTLFFAADDGVHGTELWKTDGTAAGTALVKDIHSGSAGASLDGQYRRGLPPPFAFSAGRLFFGADDGVHGLELWATDGTEAGTYLVRDIAPGPVGSWFPSFAVLGAEVLFAASESTHGSEIWKTDGTEAGTVLVADVYPGTSGSQPYELTTAGGSVYFTAYGETLGRELWRTDGTAAGTTLVADLNPGPGWGIAYLGYPMPFGSELVFFATDGASGLEPWATDGTAAGTRQILDLYPGATGSLPSFLGINWSLESGGRFWFHAVHPTLGREVWTSDGTAAGTAPLADVNTQTSAFTMSFWGHFWPARRLGAFSGGLLFSADRVTRGLWRSDGTGAGTAHLADIPPPQGSYWEFGHSFFSLGSRAVFSSDDLWGTDGTAAGTEALGSVPPYSSAVRLGSRAFFRGDALALHSTDGSAAGTSIVKSFAPAVYAAGPDNLAAARDRLFFTVETHGGTHEIWTSDGTEAGTGFGAALPAGTAPDGYSPGIPTPLGRKIVFTATDAASGRELWVSDGTPAGTFRLKDAFPGPGSGAEPADDGLDRPGFRVAVGPFVFFPADDGVHGSELWKTDGTEAGTVLVKDVRPGAASSGNRWLTRVRHRVFFVADDGTHGRELWVSDGTEAGTRPVADLAPGAASSVPRELAAVGHKLLFHAFDPAHGVEPWESDGTAAGTRRIADIAPGPLPSTPLAFTEAGPNVYFAATDGATGLELWAFPRAELGSSFAGDVPTSHWAWRFIETLADAGITSGCGPGAFCPASPVTRAEVAVFLGRAAHGDAFLPPPGTGTAFTDVPAGFWAGAWIEQLARDGVTAGCGGGQYCPGTQLSRAEMAVLLLRAAHGADYFPPPATGTRFTDVPADHWVAAWIEQLAAEGITGGCGGGLYCPAGTVTRAEMAVFLVQTFGLAAP